MSGQWEIVGKKKEKSQKIGTQVNKKKVENLNVKVDEVLGKSQMKNLYSNNKNKENKPVDIKKGSDQAPKKAQKKQEKSSEIPKPKPPKSIESALKQINVDEFKDVYENSRSHFPDAPIVWLKDLVHFLNQKINIEVQDPIFLNRVQNFPLEAVPTTLKSVIEKAIQDAKKTNVQLFFDIILTSMATDMNKNQSSVGHKIFLQYIALNDPNLVTANLSKHCALRNSYQNRPNIGLSILWAVGQAGYKDFNAGITIFQELMLPLIEMKNYSRYVVKYLLDLINNSREIFLTAEQLLFILDVIFLNKKNFANDLKQDLIACVPNLKSLFNGNKNSFRNAMELFLKKLGTLANEEYENCLSEIILQGFSRDSSCLEYWSKIFIKTNTASAILLKYIHKNWETVSKKLDKKKFKEAMIQISTIGNEFLVKKKKHENTLESIRLAQNLLEKMSQKKNSGSSLKLFLFMTILLTAGFIVYDIKQQGSWPKSITAQFLKKSGACDVLHSVANKSRQGLWYVDQQIEENYPEYRKAVIDFSESYIELSQNLGRMFYNVLLNLLEITDSKYPAIRETYQSFAPDFEHSQNLVSNIWSSSVFYVNKSIHYLKEEVFVGQLSPENMQKVVIQAFNTTQNKATEYYHWLYEKVQSTIS